ncbi:NACHT domain-containing protein [Streptomyces tendae]|uniref:NACHT domain-containing protein n=1 Tax=Streptomyces tendae TaxID=1932 RepID=UPI0036B35137
MSATGEHAPGRATLTAQLGELQAELRRRRRTQKAAVEEANRRRRKAAGRPEDEPWLRVKGGLDLSVQTVNDWFPKRNGSNEPSLPRDFEDLWAVVAVILEWTGQLPKQSEDIHHRRWKALHADAWRGTSLGEDVRAYLEAARESAGKHPYPELGLQDPPALAGVYVRRRSSRQAPGELDASRGENPAATTSGASPAAPAEPAEAVFRRNDRVCVLIAGPGGGKSTLLSTWVREAAGRLGGTQNPARTGEAVPVWVSARTLAGEETQVPDALAAATRKLSRYGRHPELDRARFLERPCPGAYWQLLVDGLDELPNQAERRAVLEKLAHAVAGDPPLYRCVVATRPLAAADLEILDRVLDSPAPRYELRPFTSDDLHTYIEKYFGTRWPQEEAARHAQQFTDALRSASLVELARIPLMAFMLCQLHLAQPERPLPAGRTAVYDAFTDLLYENNHSKRVAASHEKAIENLVHSLQSPRARQEADKAARQVHQHLPELVDYLAHQWLIGNETAVSEVLASHEAVRRPDKVRAEQWDAFLEDLLRHTGLLVHHADGLNFPHQTLLEYRAARYATRDKQARTQLLQTLVTSSKTSPDGRFEPPALEPSYLGFLLDGLLAPQDRITAETIQFVEELTAQGGFSACRFLTTQVQLRTNLPPGPTAARLARLADDTSLDGSTRVEAAEALAWVNREAGAARLTKFTDISLYSFVRVEAAEALARVDGEAGAAYLARLADDTSLDDADRVQTAEALAWVDREAGAAHLARLADDTSLNRSFRLEAARVLTEVDRDTGIACLTRLADDSSLNDADRVQTAEALAWVNREAGAAHLARLADDTSLNDADRVEAARVLTWADRDTGAARLTSFINDTSQNGSLRVGAAWVLARVDRDAGAAHLARLADDTSLNDAYRLRAARVLTWADREAGGPGSAR